VSPSRRSSSKSTARTGFRRRWPSSSSAAQWRSPLGCSGPIASVAARIFFCALSTLVAGPIVAAVFVAGTALATHAV
jgi:hypothetical protein